MPLCQSCRNQTDSKSGGLRIAEGVHSGKCRRCGAALSGTARQVDDGEWRPPVDDSNPQE